MSLETKWITQDGYFRLFTTLLGMHVVDCYKVAKEREDTIIEFAGMLAEEIMSEAGEMMEE